MHELCSKLLPFSHIETQLEYSCNLYTKCNKKIDLNWLAETVETLTFSLDWGPSEFCIGSADC